MGERDLDPIPEPAAARLPHADRPLPTPPGFRDDAHAVVIGINRYADPRIPDLRYAAADAQAFHDVLTDPALGRFRPENVTLLLDADATERRIRSAIGTELPRRASAEHTVCVFFAGHGAPVINARTGSRDGLEKYLLPHDALADDLRSSAIPMDDVHKFFDWIDTSQVIFFIDSCYSGVAGGRTFGPSDFAMRATVTDDFLDVLAGEGRLVVTACAMNEVALEKEEIGHGLFTYHLIEGLKGRADAGEDGLVTLDELYDYVYRNVERQARELGGSMNPLRKGFVKGTVYLTQYETSTMRRVRETTTAADTALRRNDLDEAGRRWQEILDLDPTSESARQGLAAITERRASEQAVRERNESIRLEALRARQRVLLEHRVSGALSLPLYVQAMDLLEQDVGSLRTADRMRREDTDALIDGRITVEQYIRSMALLAAESPDTGTHRVPVIPSQPEPDTEPARPRRRTSKGAEETSKAGDKSKAGSRTAKSSTEPTPQRSPRASRQSGGGNRTPRPRIPERAASAERLSPDAAPNRLRSTAASTSRAAPPEVTPARGGGLRSFVVTAVYIVLAYLGALAVASITGDDRFALLVFVPFEFFFAAHVRRLVRRRHYAAVVLGVAGMTFYGFLIWVVTH